ncbi:unnamed protein product [Closterium sp. NIES-53]
MVDRLPALRRRVVPTLQKGDLPTQQVDGVPTLQQSGCPALPHRRQQCARLQVRTNDWPDLHRCASVSCCLRQTSHIDFGIPTRSCLRHRDLDDVRVPSQNSPSRLPGRPRQPHVLCKGGANTPFPLTDPTRLTIDLREKHLPAAETSVVVVGAAHGTPRTPFFEVCSPPPFPPPTLLLLLLTCLVLRRSRLLLLLVGSAAAARAREARVVEVAAGVVVVEAVEVAEVAVGVVAGVGASVEAVVAAVGVVVVVVVAAVGVVVTAVVAVGVELFRGEVLALARGSTSNV